MVQQCLVGSLAGTPAVAEYTSHCPCVSSSAGRNQSPETQNPTLRRTKFQLQCSRVRSCSPPFALRQINVNIPGDTLADQSGWQPLPIPVRVLYPYNAAPDRLVGASKRSGVGAKRRIGR